MLKYGPLNSISYAYSTIFERVDFRALFEDYWLESPGLFSVCSL